jgi:aminoglycoside phosphotransferase (APT) family kinase protein
MTQTDDAPSPRDLALFAWLHEVTGASGDPAGYSLVPLAGGNSNDTALVRYGDHRWVVRRPPARPIAPDANDLRREHRVLSALCAVGAGDGPPVRVPRVIAPLPAGQWRDTVGQVILMEWVDGVSITDELPEAYTSDDLPAIGHELVDALAGLHAVDWRAAGLGDLGRPEGYLARQIDRRLSRIREQEVRPLPAFATLGAWLEANLPPEQEPALLHGDLHLDNTLFRRDRPVLAALIDFELATIGDPLVDLGLLLGFWGTDRPDPPAMPRLQGVTRHPAAPSRTELAQRYHERTGRDVTHVDWYVAFALWRLASIVEGAYALMLRGGTDTPYARELVVDVPRLLEEAELAAGRAERGASGPVGPA